MKSDQFIFYPKKRIVRGSRTGKTYTMGDRIWIRVKNTDLAKRNIDFQIVS
jgi:ribonuclease R/exosome complex exonuclease DIS3/RRP44